LFDSNALFSWFDSGIFGSRPKFWETRVSKDDLIQVIGGVQKILGGGRYEILLDSGQTVTAQLSGRMRRFRIRVIPGDRVQVGLSPYDPTHGFITFRLREGQDAPG
jgi:translation initiation factor IF-1